MQNSNTTPTKPEETDESHLINDRHLIYIDIPKILNDNKELRQESTNLKNEKAKLEQELKDLYIKLQSTAVESETRMTQI